MADSSETRDSRDRAPARSWVGRIADVALSAAVSTVVRRKVNHFLDQLTDEDASETE
jgi:hypothetical protein